MIINTTYFCIALYNLPSTLLDTFEAQETEMDGAGVTHFTHAAKIELQALF